MSVAAPIRFRALLPLLILYALSSMILIADVSVVQAVVERRGNTGQSIAACVAVCLPIALGTLYGLVVRPVAARVFAFRWTGWHEAAGFLLLWLVTTPLALGLIRVLWWL
ncbi:MAG: hypothetical protein QM783_09330 [Phycisphaerales bacterium]